MTHSTELREFEWTAAPRIPTGPHKKLKLYVDINVPEPVVEELRSAGLTLYSAKHTGTASRPDQAIYQEARKRGLVILTMDSDFWQDREHPIQATAGIIFVDVPPGDHTKACAALACFYTLFAKHYPLNWWRGMKARIYERGFTLRFHTWDGKISEEEFRLDESRKLLTRTSK